MKYCYKSSIVHSIIIILIFCIAFFPAYLWEQPHLAWVGQLITMLFALATYIPWIRDKWLYGLFVLGGIIARGFVIESVWVMTWLPYGQFAYGKALWPLLPTGVPYMLALTWPPLVLWVWSLLRIEKKRYDSQENHPQKSNQKNHFEHNVSRQKKLQIVYKYFFYSVLWWVGLTIVDLILDPIAVAMWLWTYAQPWWRWGVPRTNFMWWLFSGTVATYICLLYIKKITISQDIEVNSQIEKPSTKQYYPSRYRYAWWLIYTLTFFVAWYVWKIVL